MSLLTVIPALQQEYFRKQRHIWDEETKEPATQNCIQTFIQIRHSTVSTASRILINFQRESLQTLETHLCPSSCDMKRLASIDIGYIFVMTIELPKPLSQILFTHANPTIKKIWKSTCIQPNSIYSILPQSCAVIEQGMTISQTIIRVKQIVKLFQLHSIDRFTDKHAQCSFLCGAMSTKTYLLLQTLEVSLAYT